MIPLSVGQYTLVYNAFSFTLATMAAASVFLWMGRSQVSTSYKTALAISGLVTAVAAYHYFRIFNSWNAAFTLSNNAYVGSGTPFNDAYRYVDWFLTVPLLIAELIAVMGVASAKRGGLTARLVIAAAAMIALGYPGEIATTTLERAIWGTLSTIPFLYIVYELFVGLSPVIQAETGQAKLLLRNIRFLLIGTWGFYPIVFMIPLFFGSARNPTAVVAVQIGYCVADVLAKCGYGVMIYAIARAKTAAEATSTPVAVSQTIASTR